jgi:D-tyrosyl-tRNA(Tyr) deacylase
MRAVVQRVASASVTAGEYTAAIDSGIVAHVGVERGDGPEDVGYIARKILELRVFPSDDRSKEFDKNICDIGGALLVVSQFTLAADCRKGRRPAFDAAAPPDEAKPLYESVVAALRDAGVSVATGVFQAMMQISLVNDGPVTMLLDSKKRF